jgi:hypothetical protein
MEIGKPFMNSNVVITRLETLLEKTVIVEPDPVQIGDARIETVQVEKEYGKKHPTAQNEQNEQCNEEFLLAPPRFIMIP